MLILLTHRWPNQTGVLPGCVVVFRTQSVVSELRMSPPTPTPLKIKNQDEVTGSPHRTVTLSKSSGYTSELCVCVCVCLLAVCRFELDSKVGGVECRWPTVQQRLAGWSHDTLRWAESEALRTASPPSSRHLHRSSWAPPPGTAQSPTPTPRSRQRSGDPPGGGRSVAASCWKAWQTFAAVKKEEDQRALLMCPNCLRCVCVCEREQAQILASDHER